MAATHGVWAVLSRAVGEDMVHMFMFMGEAYGSGTRILLFKHIDTRRYLNLSHEGKFYRYEACTYFEIERGDALRHALS